MLAKATFGAAVVSYLILVVSPANEGGYTKFPDNFAPVIDLADLDPGKYTDGIIPDDVYRRIGKDLVIALKQPRVAYLVNYGVNFDTMLDEAKNLFAIDIVNKETYHETAMTRKNGFHLDTLHEKFTLGLHNNIRFKRSYDENGLRKHIRDGVSTPNEKYKFLNEYTFKDQLAGFKGNLIGFHNKTATLMERLIRCLSFELTGNGDKLGQYFNLEHLNEDSFKDEALSRSTRIVLNHYPATDGDDDDGEERFKRHKDRGFLTLVKATGPGLQFSVPVQFINPDDERNGLVTFDAPYDANCLILHGGMWLQDYVSDQIEAIDHGVGLTPRSRAANTAERYSVAVFAHFTENLTIQPVSLDVTKPAGDPFEVHYQ